MTMYTFGEKRQPRETEALMLTHMHMEASWICHGDNTKRSLLSHYGEEEREAVRAFTGYEKWWQRVTVRGKGNENRREG